jgi:hypothetical protein
VSPRCWFDASLSPSRRNVTERTFLHVVQDCERVAAEHLLLFGLRNAQRFVREGLDGDLGRDSDGPRLLTGRKGGSSGLNRPRSLP